MRLAPWAWIRSCKGGVTIRADHRDQIGPELEMGTAGWPTSPNTKPAPVPTRQHLITALLSMVRLEPMAAA